MVSPNVYVHHYLNMLAFDDFEYFWAFDSSCFLDTTESFQLITEIADKHDIVGKVVDKFEKHKIRFSIRAANGSQNELERPEWVGRVNANHQGFVIGTSWAIIFHCIIIDILNFEAYF